MTGIHTAPRRQDRIARVAACLAGLILALSAAACSSLANIDQPVSLIEPAKQQETKPAAQREHWRILAAYGGPYNDPKLEKRINAMVERLVAASEHPDQHYRVIILNSPAVNAFALPSGQLYITRGLIGLANDGSELASVLAHEMAHVIANHAAIRENEARRAALVANATAESLADTPGAALAIAKQKLALASFSRAQEFEADAIGVGIATRAGYDPHGAARFLTSMGRFAGLRSASGIDPRSIDFLSSHPATPERIENAEKIARQHEGGVRDEEFLSALNGLVYGEDPIEGFVRGRRFVHPKHGFAFTAPKGFRLENTAQAVLGTKEGGNQALRLDIVHLETAPSLVTYLNSGWIDNIEPGSVKELVIGGYPAVTASAKGDQWWFRLFLIQRGKEVFRFIYATKKKTAEVDRSFRDSIGTFRRLSLSEAASAKPLRLKIVTVAPGDTVERLASRMALIDRQVERFRILNGLNPGEQVKPGERVKLVVE
jgi:predicted Zn-dependent protease